MKKFYSHLIEVETLTVELEQMDLSDHEKKTLAHLVDANLHHTILDAIFDELKDEDKHAFLRVLASDDHDKIWDFLKARIDLVEEKIKKTAIDLKTKMKKDIADAKKKGEK